MEFDKNKLKAFFVALMLLIAFVFVNTNFNWLLLNKQKGISWQKTVLFLKDYVNENGSINLHTFFPAWYPSVGIARYLSYHKLNVQRYDSYEFGDNPIKIYNKDAKENQTIRHSSLGD